jgi:hypothetical protein
MRLVEALAALTLTVGVLFALHALVRQASIASGRMLVEAQVLETRRLALGLLDRELAGARPDTDWVADPAGLALRAFRGSVEACAPTSVGLIGTRVGVRAPDPAKDSLELVLAEGTRRVVALAAVSAPGVVAECFGAGPVELLRWVGDDEPGPPAVFARYFERGLYAVDDALRYRRGRGGRQPLGAAVLDPARSDLGVVEGAVDLRLAWPGVAAVATRRWVR